MPGLEARVRLPPARILSVAGEPQQWQAPTRPPVARYTVLSNGHYSTLINSDGGGGSFWQGIGINRWQPDVSTNVCGQWIYVRDLESDHLFTVTTDPCGERTDDRLASQGPQEAGFRCRHGHLVCRMRVAVAAQHDIEARRVSISNQSGKTRRIVVSSFAELSLAPPREFERHPAFARLFIESDCLPDEQMLVFRRRPRSSEEKPLYVAHMAIVAGDSGKAFGYETDRGRFIGRNGSIIAPAGLARGIDSLSGRTGAVVDPAMAAAVEIELEPYGHAEAVFLTGAGRSRRELLGALREYRAMGRIDWLFEQARMQTSQELHHLDLAPGAVETAMKLMSATLEPHPAWRRTDLRPREAIQGLLWSRGISGDWPIIAVTARASSRASIISDIIQAHTLMAGRQVRVDLVIIDEEAGGYEQPTRDRLYEISESIRARVQRVLTGPVIIVSGRDLSVQQRNAILAAAAVVLDADGPALADQLHPEAHRVLPALIPVRSEQEADRAAPSLERPENLQFDNSIGGFSADGREYVIHLEPGETTPAPWSNVLANPDFGTLVTEAGTSYTWAGNSSEYRLTPWPNDPVMDPSGEVIYLRDEETGRVWTPTPFPRPGEGAYQIRHGHGVTTFLHNGQGLIHRHTIHVDPYQPVKICTLELTNTCDWTRRITVTGYLEWVLGNRRGETGMHVESDLAMEARALLARNSFDRFAGQAHAFVATSLPIHGFTTDRTEFLGQGGDTRWPAAMWRIGLSGVLTTAADSCAALQCHLDIPAGETRRVSFVIGHGRDREHAVELARRFTDPDEAERSARQNRERWQALLGRVQVETPDRSLNLLLNAWLPYQAISSRLWGRTGYYQSSGGIGFRDQLQDAMAMIWLDPPMTRQQILVAAARQFREGDVLHWWHESPLRGVRTRCSDDLLWLPFVTARYVRATGDVGILGEEIAYLAGEPLAAEEAERYAEFEPLSQRGSLYEHCCRAIDRASTVGPHGLPIIGSGDWNDGFNRVSTTGRGESVWL
ncbi:MAG: GH36-type glycosyl hydrolase domain-containing protein, partial [Wenzhouxiangella sp.]